jgi:hypothetical protein
MRRNLAACLLLLAASCGSARPGVGVQKLQANVVFGVKPSRADVAERQAEAAQAPPERTLPPVVALPQTKFRPPLGAPPPAACPAAAVNAFPAREAGFNVTDMPRPGAYRWKRSGTQTLATAGGLTLPVGGFEQRYLRRVTKVSDTQFGYQTVRKELNTGNLLVATWQVKTAATQETAGTVVGPNVRAGEPDRGLALVRLDRYDSKGSLAGSFAPAPSILYLPLPVLVGEQWTSHGVSPATGETWQLQGTVKGRQRVDACGEVIDGWGVEGSLTQSGGTNATTYKFVVATQLGGVLTSEFIDGTTPTGTMKVTFSVGQLDPDPLPDEAK